MDAVAQREVAEIWAELEALRAEVSAEVWRRSMDMLWQQRMDRLGNTSAPSLSP